MPSGKSKPINNYKLNHNRHFSKRLPVSTILYLGGSCCALFGARLLSTLRVKNNKVHHFSTTTDSFLSNNMDPQRRKDLENRLKGALWGFFAGDALSSPTHWFYGGQRQIIAEYGHPIDDYTQPNKYLTGSILNKSDPNGGGRGSSTGNKKTSIVGDVINHGKLHLWDPSKSHHYHATLHKGETTLEASLARVLMKSIVSTDGIFDPDHFRQAYLDFMQTPGSHNDTYASTCHRMFFANLIFQNLPPKDCPDNDKHNVDTIDGLVLPTIVALADLRNQQTTSSAAAATCAGVTRKSGVLEKVARQWSSVVLGAFSIDEDSFSNTLKNFATQTIQRRPNPRVDEASTMSACYLGSSLPGLVDMVAKHADGGNVWKALLANANVGGENVHRGSILGAVLGARAGYDSLPSNLVDGLYAKTEIEHEIKSFVDAVLPN